jgi:hypothetical protein
MPTSPSPFPRISPSCSRVVGAVLAALLLGACSSAAPSASSAPGSDPGRSRSSALPATDHVHALAIDPADGAALMATHDGLFRISPQDSERVGPVIDLMGFSVVGPSHYVASGHPGPGTDLPDPVGLIESTDGGRTWEPVSRTGESDFHALDAWPGGVIALGESLERSDDLRSWSPLETPAGLYDVSSPDGLSVIATTPDGLQMSGDGGRSWQPASDAPLLQFVEHANTDLAVGLSPDGVLYRTADAGASWERAGDVGETPVALAVSPVEPNQVLVLTSSGVRASVDGGATFSSW